MIKNKNITLNKFGKYSEGLIASEIKLYLKSRSKDGKLGTLYKQFCKLGVFSTKELEAPLTVVPREDIRRLCDLIFGNK